MIFLSFNHCELQDRSTFDLVDPYPPYRQQYFTTIRRQIWQIFDPFPPKQCRRLKWIVPKSTLLLIGDVEINGANEVVILSDTVDVCIQKLTIRHQIIVFKLKSLKDVGCRCLPRALLGRSGSIRQSERPRFEGWKD